LEVLTLYQINGKKLSVQHGIHMDHVPCWIGREKWTDFAMVLTWIIGHQCYGWDVKILKLDLITFKGLYVIIICNYLWSKIYKFTTKKILSLKLLIWKIFNCFLAIKDLALIISWNLCKIIIVHFSNFTTMGAVLQL